MSRRATWLLVPALGLLMGVPALAQSSRGPMGPGMMGGGPGMMGPGMMGHRPMEGAGMGMGCPMWMPGTRLEVKKLDDGASISVTSTDPKLVSRIQKRAEIMRLMHELEEEERAPSP